MPNLHTPLRLISVKLPKFFPKLQKTRKLHSFLTRVQGHSKEGDFRSFWKGNDNTAEISRKRGDKENRTLGFWLLAFSF